MIKDSSQIPTPIKLSNDENHPLLIPDGLLDNISEFEKIDIPPEEEIIQLPSNKKNRITPCCKW